MRPSRPSLMFGVILCLVTIAVLVIVLGYK
jgi:hypothetical protein